MNSLARFFDGCKGRCTSVQHSIGSLHNGTVPSCTYCFNMTHCTSILCPLILGPIWRLWFGRGSPGLFNSCNPAWLSLPLASSFVDPSWTYCNSSGISHVHCTHWKRHTGTQKDTRSLRKSSHASSLKRWNCRHKGGGGGDWRRELLCGGLAGTVTKRLLDALTETDLYDQWPPDLT